MDKDAQEITEAKQQLTEAAFSNHTPMMQQYLCTSPDASANEVQSDHVHPDSMARIATRCPRRPGDKLDVDALSRIP